MGAGEEILAMIKSVREQQLERRTDCPNCGWPLNEHPTKGLHCPLGDWAEFPYRRKNIDES